MKIRNYHRTARPPSHMRRIAEDPSLDVVVASDDASPPQASPTQDGPTMALGEGVHLHRLAVEAAARDKLIGKTLKLMDLNLDVTQQGMALAGLQSPAGLDTAFTVSSCVLAGADLHHTLTRGDADAFDIAISSSKALATVADVVAPLLPGLQQYQPHLKFLTLVLTAVGTTKEVLELSCELDDLAGK